MKHQGWGSREAQPQQRRVFYERHQCSETYQEITDHYAVPQWTLNNPTFS